MDILTTIISAAAVYTTLRGERNRQHISILTRNIRYREVLSNENDAYFFNNCGMKKHVYKLLLKKLRSVMGGLKSSRKIKAGIKLMIFLSTLRGNSFRTTATIWQVGYRQISSSVHEVINSLMNCQSDIWQNSPEPVLSDHIKNNDKYYPYFNYCLGAIDGTHIMAKVSSELQQRFRGRKGVTV